MTPAEKIEEYAAKECGVWERKKVLCIKDATFGYNLAEEENRNLRDYIKELKDELKHWSTSTKEEQDELWDEAEETSRSGGDYRYEEFIINKRNHKVSE